MWKIKKKSEVKIISLKYFGESKNYLGIIQKLLQRKTDLLPLFMNVLKKQ